MRYGQRFFAVSGLVQHSGTPSHSVADPGGFERILKIDYVLTKLSPSFGLSTFLGQNVDGTRLAAVKDRDKGLCLRLL